MQKSIRSKYNIIYNELFKKIDLLPKDKKYVLYGDGIVSRIIHSLIPNVITGIVDIKSEVIDKNINKNILYSPYNLRNMEYDKVIVTVLAREEEILKFLQEECNVKIENIHVLFGMENQEYEIIISNATYSPWTKDLQFLDTYNDVSKHSLVDIYRMYELWTLVEESAKLEEGSFLEIGVWKGGTSALIAKKIQDLGLKQKLFACDTFSGVVKVTEKDLYYKGGEHNDTNFEHVQNLFMELKLNNITILKGIFPDETGEFLQNEKFRFCHIDVDIYESAKDILEWIWDKTVLGGIIIFDDYGFETCSGIRDFVNEQKKLKDRFVIHNLNGHAIIIKIK